jgi:hypothetical protein
MQQQVLSNSALDSPQNELIVSGLRNYPNAEQVSSASRKGKWGDGRDPGRIPTVPCLAGPRATAQDIWLNPAQICDRHHSGG